MFGTYQAGDRFRVAVEGGVVKYRRNGVLFYTSAGAPAYPLLVDTALYSLGGDDQRTWSCRVIWARRSLDRDRGRVGIGRAC